jgi:hypothetical protein
MPDARPGSVRPVAGDATPSVSVTLNTGERITGTKVEETKDWLVITTEDGRRVRVRPQEVRRIDESGKAPVKPAGGGD